jgi:hypothetical protein
MPAVKTLLIIGTIGYEVTVLRGTISVYEVAINEIFIGIIEGWYWDVQPECVYLLYDRLRVIVVLSIITSIPTITPPVRLTIDCVA